MRVGLLGGSFDPVHDGHIKLALAARRQLKLAKVFLVLTPTSPFKTKQKISPVARRLRWLKAAIKGKPGLTIGSWELKKQGAAYSVDTLKDYAWNHPQHELFFVMGSDSWKTFSRWKNPDKIARMAKLVVGRRPGSTSIKIPKKYKSSVIILKGRFPAISSTQIRASQEFSSRS